MATCTPNNATMSNTLRLFLPELGNFTHKLVGSRATGHFTLNSDWDFAFLLEDRSLALTTLVKKVGIDNWKENRETGAIKFNLPIPDILTPFYIDKNPVCMNMLFLSHSDMEAWGKATDIIRIISESKGKSFGPLKTKFERVHLFENLVEYFGGNRPKLGGTSFG